MCLELLDELCVCVWQAVCEAGQELPVRGSLQGVPHVHVLPPLPPVEIPGAPAGHVQDIPHVSGSR